MFEINPEGMLNFRFRENVFLDRGPVYRNIVQLRCATLSMIFGLFCKRTGELEDIVGI